MTTKKDERIGGTSLERRAEWLADEASRLAASVPGADVATRTFWALQKPLLQAVKQQLAELEGDSRGAAPGSRGGAEPSAAPETPHRLLTDMLARSLDQSPEQSRDCFFVSLLRTLVPDEARILAALSDGTLYPLIHVGYGPTFGQVSHRTLENASNVGRACGVALLRLVPVYVSRLRAFGLAETAPEDAALGIKYEMLQTDDLVRDAMRRVEELGQKPKLLRRTLRISPLGRELWEAAMTPPAEAPPTEDDEP